MLFDDPEHGEHVARLHNLINWTAGNNIYEKFGKSAQEKIKTLERAKKWYYQLHRMILLRQG